MTRIKELRQAIDALKPQCSVFMDTDNLTQYDCENFCPEYSKCEAAYEARELLRDPIFICGCGDGDNHKENCDFGKLRKNRRKLEDLLRKDNELCGIFIRLAGIE